MSVALADRLNQILPRITGASFLSSKGIGNEIACYIFDYPAEGELQVREHIRIVVDRLASHHSEIKTLHIDLLDVVLEYLKQRGLLDKAIEFQKTKGDSFVLQALKGPLEAERIRDFIATRYIPSDYNLFLLSGVGSVWPMLRAHNLLNCLHTILGTTPLVLFYPGSFNGTELRLFDRIATNTSTPGKKPYYRAFILVPREKTEA